MQAMLMAFITMNTSNSGIPSAKTNSISRTFPPLFTIQIPKEEQIVEDLQEINSMQLVVQVIMVIVCIIVAFIVLYYCCKKFGHMRTLFKYCFPFLPILRMLRIQTHCCIFKRMIIDWTNTEVTGISGIRIEMPNEAKILIFTDNDLTHITDDHFEINLIAHLLDEICVVPSPQSPPRYDDAPPDTMTFAQSVNSTGGLMASAPMMPLHMLINPT